MEYDAELREVRGPAGVVRLPKQQGDMLALLLRRAGRLVSRDAMFDCLHSADPNDPPNERSLDVAIWRLRRGLKQAGVNDRLEIVRSAGWVWREKTQ